MGPRALRTGAVVAATLLAAACSGDDGDSGGEPALATGDTAGVPDSAELSEPVAARGRVTDEDGSAVAGAEVHLVVWPEEAALETIEEGEEVPLAMVARTSSSDDGGYELRIPADLRAGLVAGPDGLVDFEVSAATADAVASFSWSGPAEVTHPQMADLELTEVPG